MTRPVTRTALVNPDALAQMRSLFGGPTQAFKKLGVEPHVSLSEFRSAFAMLYVPPHVAITIEQRWQEWRDEFLKPPLYGVQPDAEAERRARGEYHAQGAYDPASGMLLGAAESFTLPPLAQAPAITSRQDRATHLAEEPEA
jgi:hypothetical protein